MQVRVASGKVRSSNCTRVQEVSVSVMTKGTISVCLNFVNKAKLVVCVREREREVKSEGNKGGRKKGGGRSGYLIRRWCNSSLTLVSICSESPVFAVYALFLCSCPSLIPFRGLHPQMSDSYTDAKTLCKTVVKVFLKLVAASILPTECVFMCYFYNKHACRLYFNLY